MERRELWKEIFKDVNSSRVIPQSTVSSKSKPPEIRTSDFPSLSTLRDANKLDINNNSSHSTPSDCDLHMGPPPCTTEEDSASESGGIDSLQADDDELAYDDDIHVHDLPNPRKKKNKKLNRNNNHNYNMVGMNPSQLTNEKFSNISGHEKRDEELSDAAATELFAYQISEAIKKVNADNLNHEPINANDSKQNIRDLIKQRSYEAPLKESSTEVSRKHSLNIHSLGTSNNNTEDMHYSSENDLRSLELKFRPVIWPPSSLAVEANIRRWEKNSRKKSSPLLLSSTLKFPDFVSSPLRRLPSKDDGYIRDGGGGSNKYEYDDNINNNSNNNQQRFSPVANDSDKKSKYSPQKNNIYLNDANHKGDGNHDPKTNGTDEMREGKGVASEPTTPISAQGLPTAKKAANPNKSPPRTKSVSPKRSDTGNHDGDLGSKSNNTLNNNKMTSETKKSKDTNQQQQLESIQRGNATSPPRRRKRSPLKQRFNWYDIFLSDIPSQIECNIKESNKVKSIESNTLEQEIKLLENRKVKFSASTDNNELISDLNVQKKLLLNNTVENPELLSIENICYFESSLNSIDFKEYKQLIKQISHNPSNITLLLRLACFLLRKGYPAQATSVLCRACELLPILSNDTRLILSRTDCTLIKVLTAKLVALCIGDIGPLEYLKDNLVLIGSDAANFSSMSPMCLVHVASVHFVLGFEDTADEHLKLALEIDSECMEATHARAMVLARLGKGREATRLLHRMAQCNAADECLFPERGTQLEWARLEIAWLQEYFGNEYSSILQAYRSSFPLGAKGRPQSLCFVGLASLNHTKREWPQAIEKYDRALKADDNNYMALILRAIAMISSHIVQVTNSSFDHLNMKKHPSEYGDEINEESIDADFRLGLLLTGDREHRWIALLAYAGFTSCFSKDESRHGGGISSQKDLNSMHLDLSLTGGDCKRTEEILWCAFECGITTNGVGGIWSAIALSHFYQYTRRRLDLATDVIGYVRKIFESDEQMQDRFSDEIAALLVAQAYISMESGDMEEALHLAKEAVKKSPTLPAAIRLIAMDMWYVQCDLIRNVSSACIFPCPYVCLFIRVILSCRRFSGQREQAMQYLLYGSLGTSINFILL